jgi:hypothetical protein
VASVVGLPSLFHRLCGSLEAPGVESLWPQNSVSKVAVCDVATAPDFEWPFEFEARHCEPVRMGQASLPPEDK